MNKNKKQQRENLSWTSFEPGPLEPENRQKKGLYYSQDYLRERLIPSFKRGVYSISIKIGSIKK